MLGERDERTYSIRFASSDFEPYRELLPLHLSHPNYPSDTEYEAI